MISAAEFEPPHVGDDEFNYTDMAGARTLKERIEAYWRERGYDVRINLPQAGFTAALRAARVDVRSDMVNGLPRNWGKPPAPAAGE